MFERMSKEQRDVVLDARMRRGAAADELMANPLLKQTLDTLERDIIASMKTLEIKDEEGRDALWRELKALGRFKSKLADYSSTGNAAKKTIMQRIKEKI